MASLNNLVLGLVLRLGFRYLPDARQWCAACLPDLLQLVLQPLP